VYLLGISICFALLKISINTIKMSTTNNFLATMSLLCGMTLVNQVQAQNNLFPSTGNAGIGTQNVAAPPKANLHLHGSTNYTEYNRDGQTIAHGTTTRMLFTTTQTGTTDVDGFVMRMSTTHMTMRNQTTNGNVTLRSQGALLHFQESTKRISLGHMLYNTTQTQYAAVNVHGNNDNGMYIRATTPGRYGLRVEVNNSDGNAIEVVENNALPLPSIVCNFRVKQSGEVYARKYTTTLNNFPDYVFAPTYSLMPLTELRTYINTNHHLPNIPSAEEIEAQPVDLGELTRLMLEKIEENTLYILQLEQRIKELEGK
jgi:hypothetical protein